jgi:hypothetical protein
MPTRLLQAADAVDSDLDLVARFQCPRLARRAG